MAAAADSPIKRDIVGLLCPLSLTSGFFRRAFLTQDFLVAVRKMILNFKFIILHITLVIGPTHMVVVMDNFRGWASMS